MALVKEFKEFISRGNVLDLAVAVVIGAAFTKIVTALVEGFIMPIVGTVLPEGNWRAWRVTGLDLELGRVLSALLDFLLVALVLFFVVKKLLKSIRREKAAAPVAPITKACPECLEEIPIAAHKCRACTSVQPALAP
jgi:large conductance mechanosensitive channel